MLVLDVGANNGVWSETLYRLIKEYDPGFHLFEAADYYCFAPLSAAADRIPHSTVIRKAVADRVGTLKFFLPDRGSGLGSLHERRDTSVRAHEYRVVEVPAITLDDYIGQAGIDHVDILKIDVEGGELDVLRGATNALANAMVGHDHVRVRLGQRELSHLLSRFLGFLRRAQNSSCSEYFLVLIG